MMEDSYEHDHDWAKPDLLLSEREIDCKTTNYRGEQPLPPVKAS